MNGWWRAIAFCAALLIAAPALAGSGETAPRYSLGSSLGLVYDPSEDINFLQISAAALYDYEQIWRHPAPESLRFKVEAQLGFTTGTRMRSLASANIFALYFLDRFTTARLRPYLEAGIGLIYTDFQVQGQGLRINFNPQVGVGMEFGGAQAPPWFVALRLHHVSNGGLHKDNRGINSAVFQLGRFF